MPTPDPKHQHPPTQSKRERILDKGVMIFAITIGSLTLAGKVLAVVGLFGQ